MVVEAFKGKILIDDMALEKWHKTDEMVTSNMKMGWNCNSDRENRK